MIFKKHLSVLLVFLFSICICAFNDADENKTAKNIFVLYKTQVNDFSLSLVKFKQALASKNQQQIQQAFINARASYKKIECFTEYYFPVFAKQINGPPIPLADDLDLEVAGPEPKGLQVIEPLLFPKYPLNNQKEVALLIQGLQTAVKELSLAETGTAITDETIFDALIEEMYRLTATGLTGYDCPVVLSSIPETASALTSITKTIVSYKSYFDLTSKTSFDSAIVLIKNAEIYCNQHKRFNSFDRSFFIRHYLNPLTILICNVKIKYGFKSNPSPNYYAAINKTGSLFAADAFSTSPFTDDRKVTEERIAFGRKLFYEKRLSSDNSRSCADCHNPSKGFTDGLPKSIELNGHTALTRNAPTLWNVGYQRNLFMDGRGLNLEHQVILVLSNQKEMNESAQEAALKIISMPLYKAEYDKIYPDATESEAAINIANAIACYERTLISFNSRFDKYMRGDTLQLTKREVNGFNIFAGKARCATCHFIPLFNGSKPPRFYYQETEVIGVPLTTDTINTVIDSDEGRFLFTKLPFQKFSFKTPTLRNIAITGPYMHNGVYQTLEEIMDFYEKGGGKGLKIDPPNETLPFDKLKLTVSETKDVVEFMKALTDTSSIN